MDKEPFRGSLEQVDATCWHSEELQAGHARGWSYLHQ